MRYRDKIVLISGAAGGFGRAAARAFQAEGARLALTDLDLSRLERTAAEDGLEADGLALTAGDVRAPETAAAWVASAEARFGRIDVAINNAGVLHAPHPLAEIDRAAFEQALAVNVGGPFHGLQAQVPALRRAGGGVILNVASIAGLLGAPTLGAYAAAKHAVVGLTRTAAVELARDGVRVNALCPAFADTPMLTDLVAAGSAPPPEKLTARIPLRRLARPEEIAEAMLWLCSDANSFMTGQTIALDGGLSAM
ncbi:MAG: glucose 1-dehydrogenase [Pseudomonadota bacterium]